MRYGWLCVVLGVALTWVGEAGAREESTASDVVLLKRVTPAFPLEAYLRCVEGYVLAEFTIDPAGSVTDIDIVESEPQGAFDNAARKALAEWEFAPRIEHGRAVSDRVAQKIDFSIFSDCVVGEGVPKDLPKTIECKEFAERERCLVQGGRKFGYAELDFRIDASGRAGMTTVVRATGDEYLRRARADLAKRQFDPAWEALTLSHTFAYCVSLR